MSVVPAVLELKTRVDSVQWLDKHYNNYRQWPNVFIVCELLFSLPFQLQRSNVYSLF